MDIDQKRQKSDGADTKKKRRFRKIKKTHGKTAEKEEWNRRQQFDAAFKELLAEAVAFAPAARGEDAAWGGLGSAAGARAGASVGSRGAA